jgi:bla regulator protein blaR1
MMPGYLPAVANHLWQSTVFAAAAGLLALALSNNRAPVRFGVWLAASLKFLLPFALLVSAGTQLPWHSAPAAAHPISTLMEDFSQPFESRAPFAPAPLSTRHDRLPLLAAIWLCGAVWAATAWLRQWRKVRTAVRLATPLPLGLPVPVLLSRGNLEPGIVGIRRPVLLLPEGILERLSPEQFDAIVKHELCHVRRRDNLAAALHMIVETIFWFHPLVYWIRWRMVEERERACDEEVVGAGNAPEVYAEGILKVCRLYVEAPLVCTAPVTGADLKKRIEVIMTHAMGNDLNLAKRLLLSAAAVAALSTPVAIGILHAQSQPPAKFEVISVKPVTSGERMPIKFRSLPGGRLEAHGVPLYALISAAYGVSAQSVRLSGAPEWTRSERYDIEATAEKGAIALDLTEKERDRRMVPMLQALLADRFKLVIRRDHKEIPVYAITVAKGGIKMEKSAVDEKDCGPDVPCHDFMGGQGRGVHAKASSVEDLIGFVENWSDRPMIDRTGLEGLYKMDTDGWVPMRGPGGGNEGLDDPTRPTIFTVFEKQLGLKLESQKAVVETFVVEHVERPTGN